MSFTGPADRRAAFGLRTLVVFLVVGCGDGDGLDRVAVSGKVTVDGKPLVGGSIQFIPKDGDSRGAAWGEIAGGSYAIPAETGPAPGSFNVTIVPNEDSGASPGDTSGMPGDPPPDALGDPKVFYTPTTPMDVKVVAGTANTFDFSLSVTKAPPSRSRRR